MGRMKTPGFACSDFLASNNHGDIPNLAFGFGNGFF
jgi:hypothetical protein